MAECLTQVQAVCIVGKTSVRSVEGMTLGDICYGYCICEVNRYVGTIEVVEIMSSLKSR